MKKDLELIVKFLMCKKSHNNKICSMFTVHTVLIHHSSFAIYHSPFTKWNKTKQNKNALSWVIIILINIEASNIPFIHTITPYSEIQRKLNTENEKTKKTINELKKAENTKNDHIMWNCVWNVECGMSKNKNINLFCFCCFFYFEFARLVQMKSGSWWEIHFLYWQPAYCEAIKFLSKQKHKSEHKIEVEMWNSALACERMPKLLCECLWNRFVCDFNSSFFLSILGSFFSLPKISNGEHRFLIENSKALQFVLFLNHKHLKHLKRILKRSIQLINLIVVVVVVIISFHTVCKESNCELWMSLIFHFIWTVN